MVISKLCQECVHLDKDCEGKTNEEFQKEYNGILSKDVSGKVPCKRYELNTALLKDEPETATEQEQADSVFEDAGVSEQKQGELCDCGFPQSSPFPHEHSQSKKAQNFARLANKRLASVLDGIRKLDNLTNSYTYQWSYEQGQAIVKSIRNAVNELEQHLVKEKT